MRHELPAVCRETVNNVHHEGHEVGEEHDFAGWSQAMRQNHIYQQDSFFFQKMDRMDLRNGKTGDTSPEG